MAALPKSDCDREFNKFREAPSGGTCVAVCNDDGTAIAGGGGGSTGTPKHFKFSGTSTPGSTQTGITETVPVGKKWLLRRAIATHSMSGVSKVLVASTAEASMRTGPGLPNANYIWDLGFEVAAGVEVKVNFTAISDEIASDVELYLQVDERSA